MEAKPKGQRIQWYRCRVRREDLARLNRRSDFKGFLQTGGYLGLLAVTGGGAVVSMQYLPWYACIPIFLFHGMCWNFMINGFHELVHDSVFRTRWFNGLFLRIFSFLGWYNHIQFWASHTEHHKFTLHPPDDLEVVLPQKVTVWGFLKTGIVNPLHFWNTLKMHLRLARGRLKGDWEHHLFDTRPELRRKLFNWSRLVIAGHLLITAASLILGLWYVPVVVSLAPFYGGLIHALCNGSQHIGLRDNVQDFRLCCRTIYLNPFLQFLYWHMNYHTEHHMYAAVPCYNLPKLHRLIKHDMPPCPNGLYETWTHIAEILKRQKTDPDYQFTAELPSPSQALNEHDGEAVLGVMAAAGVRPDDDPPAQAASL